MIKENKLVNESAIRAKIQGIDKTLAELQEQLDRGYIDIGRHLRLKADWERQKAELESQLTDVTVESVSPAKRAERQKLQTGLGEYFDKEELRSLCFELGIEYDDLRGESRLGKIEGLSAYCERHGRSPELVATCRRLRPHVAC